MYRNAILASLSRDDLDLVEPDLEAVELPIRMQLERPGVPVEHVYFLESGIASRVAQVSGLQLEIGLIGHEGMSGMGLVLCAGLSPNELFIQAEGKGHRIAASAFCAATRRSPTILVACLRAVHVAWLQTAQTALANGRNTIEERLARWLLMTQDRLTGAELPLTHEFLSLMLGVHRPGVTLALHTLEGARLVRLKRSRISILNRPGLIEVAGRTYGPAEAEHARLFDMRDGGPANAELG